MSQNRKRERLTRDLERAVLSKLSGLAWKPFWGREAEGISFLGFIQIVVCEKIEGSSGYFQITSSYRVIVSKLPGIATINSKLQKSAHSLERSTKTNQP